MGRPRAQRHKRLTQNQRFAIVRKRAEGVPIEDLAREFGVTTRSIFYTLKADQTLKLDARVRSIRVWDVRHYSHRETGRDDDCPESCDMRLGISSTQEEPGWQRTTPRAAPQWGLPSRRCASSNWRRGVGVEWEDHEGNHGYEWVAY